MSFVSENESRYRFCPLSLEIGYDFQGRHEGARLNIRPFLSVQLQMDENYDVKYEKYDKAVQLSEERSEGEWTLETRFY